MNTYSLCFDGNVLTGCRGDHAVAEFSQGALPSLCWIDRFMHSAQDQVSSAVIFQVGVKFRYQLNAMLAVSYFVLRESHAENGHAERAYRNGYCPGDDAITRSHAIQRTVRFNVIEGHIFCLQQRHESPGLVRYQIGHFLWRDRHGAAAEALQIRQRRMSADFHPVPFRQLHRGTHDAWITDRKATSDICKVD